MHRHSIYQSLSRLGVNQSCGIQSISQTKQTDHLSCTCILSNGRCHAYLSIDSWIVSIQVWKWKVFGYFFVYMFLCDLSSHSCVSTYTGVPISNHGPKICMNLDRNIFLVSYATYSLYHSGWLQSTVARDATVRTWTSQPWPPSVIGEY